MLHIKPHIMQIYIYIYYNIHPHVYMSSRIYNILRMLICVYTLYMKPHIHVHYVMYRACTTHVCLGIGITKVVTNVNFGLTVCRLQKMETLHGENM